MRSLLEPFFSTLHNGVKVNSLSNSAYLAFSQIPRLHQPRRSSTLQKASSEHTYTNLSFTYMYTFASFYMCNVYSLLVLFTTCKTVDLYEEFYGVSAISDFTIYTPAFFLHTMVQYSPDHLSFLILCLYLLCFAFFLSCF